MDVNEEFSSSPQGFYSNEYVFNLTLRIPTHAIVLTWMKKQGIANFSETNFFEKEKKVLIIDEIIQIEPSGRAVISRVNFVSKNVI